MQRASIRVLLVALFPLLLQACAPDAPSPELDVLLRNDSIWARMLEAEDTRGTGPSGIRPLTDGLFHEEAAIRRIAVRALGRLEQDSLVPRIRPLLDDGSAEVRAEAANALAQAIRGRNAAVGRAALRQRIERERSPFVLGVLAESLGRMAHEDSTDVAVTVDILTGLAGRAPADSTGVALRLGVARAFFFLARQPAGRGAIGPSGPALLLRLATAAPDTSSEDVARTRAVATAALIATGRSSAADLGRILNDPDAWVRREAVAGLATLGAAAGVTALVRQALDDPSAVVRYEALRVDARTSAGQICSAALAGTTDEDTHVALLAIDRLATGCGGAAAVALLDSIAGTFDPEARREWHRPAQAAVALAALDPALASRHLPVLEASANPFVRMRAASVAALVASRDVLRRLASDSAANVRTEAVRGLSRTDAHAADDIFIATLREADDSQLLQTAAAALTGSADPDAIGALFDALDRMTERGRETERDARVALLNRIAELGDSTRAGRLSAHLDDYDPRIGTMAAEILERWTGTPQSQPPPVRRTESLPALADVQEMERARITVEMQSGARFTMRLFPIDAPMNAFRFARLAREGYYDGLTFHRIAPNFVIQGGSPNANEYSGDGPFSRDELGLRYNWRGSIGLSTRGRDTGDAQIFINLIDNVRLDHEYTVFGEVTSGFEAVRGIVEGDVIRRIRVDT